MRQKRPAVAGGLALAWLVAVVAHAVRADAHPADFSAFYAEAAGADVRVTYDLFPDALRDAVPGLDVDGDGKLSGDEVAKGSPAIARFLDAGVTLESSGAPCPVVTSGDARIVAGVRVDVDRVHRCPRSPAELVWTVRVLLAAAGSHSFLGRTRVGEAYDQWVFRPGSERHVVLASPVPAASASVGAPRAAAEPAARPSPSGLGSFFALGVRHILTGPDHLAFVIALVLAARRLRDLALVVTSFTLAHSVTLALGVFDLVHAPVRMVESIIAASIVWVAAENVARAEPRHRVGVTFAFGLLHGLGFGAALREIGWPPGGVAPALFAFNAGVEAGQLAVVVPVFLVVARWVRGSVAERTVVRGVSLVLTIAGVCWFVARALDLST